MSHIVFDLFHECDFFFIPIMCARSIGNGGFMSSCSSGQATRGANSFFGTITAVGGGSGAGALELSHCSLRITAIILILLCQLPEFLHDKC